MNMSPSPDRETIQVEADRVIDRLTGMPITRVDEAVRISVRDAAQRIVDRTPDPERPADARVPIVGPSALGAQLAVVVRDYLETTTAASDDAAVAEVAEVLTQLRRSLP